MVVKGCALWGYVGLVSISAAGIMLYKTSDALEFYNVHNTAAQALAYAGVGMTSLVGGMWAGMRSGSVLEDVIEHYRRESTKE